MYHIIKSEINHSEFYFSPNDERINVQPLASWDKYQKNKRKIGAWFWMSARPLYSLLLAKSLLLLPLTMDCIKCMQLLLLEASLHKLLHLQHLLKGTQHQHYPQFQLDLCLFAFSPVSYGLGLQNCLLFTGIPVFSLSWVSFFLMLYFCLEWLSIMCSFCSWWLSFIAFAS